MLELVDLNYLARVCSDTHASRGQLHWSSSLQWTLRGNVLAFAGSDSLIDWWHNLKFWPTKSFTGPGTVHSGFLSLARLTWPQLKQTVLGGERIKLVTGYSLGAAVAVLVAEILKDVQVVTFACPVIGTFPWIKRYPHPVTRCWVERDLITTPILNRQHFGQEVCLHGGWNPITNHQYTLERIWPK